MRTATPVALSAAGMNGVMVGLWTFDTLVPSTFSFSVMRCSEPGAPFGQRGIAGGRSVGRSAARERMETARAKVSGMTVRMGERSGEEWQRLLEENVSRSG